VANLSEMEHKIAIVGDGGVGKSALTMQFVNHQWLDTYGMSHPLNYNHHNHNNLTIKTTTDPTIEDSYRKQVEVDGEVCMLDILDTSGQEEFRAFRDQYLSMGQGFLMVYDMTNLGTFEHLGPLLESVRKHQEDEDIPLVIVANKCDCAPQRTVTTKDGQDFATSCNAVHIEVFYPLCSLFSYLIPSSF